MKEDNNNAIVKTEKAVFVGIIRQNDDERKVFIRLKSANNCQIIINIVINNICDEIIIIFFLFIFFR